MRRFVPDDAEAHVLSIAVLALAAFGLLPDRAAVPVALLSSGVGTVHAVRRHRAESMRRRQADAILTGVPGLRVPEGLRWRAEELTLPSHRRALAKHLRRLARLADERVLLTSLPLYLSTLRPNHEALESLASRVGRIEQPVAARGIVLLEGLLGDDPDTPLFSPGRAVELNRALLRIGSAIDPAFNA